MQVFGGMSAQKESKLDQANFVADMCATTCICATGNSWVWVCLVSTSKTVPISTTAVHCCTRYLLTSVRPYCCSLIRWGTFSWSQITGPMRTHVLCFFLSFFVVSFPSFSPSCPLQQYRIVLVQQLQSAYNKTYSSHRSLLSLVSFVRLFRAFRNLFKFNNKGIHSAAARVRVLLQQ